MLTAFGTGLLFPAVSVTATARVAPGDRGRACWRPPGRSARPWGSRSWRRQEPRAAVALAGGYRLSYWVAAGVAACALTVALLLLRGSAARR